MSGKFKKTVQAESYFFMNIIRANETRWILLRDDERSVITEPPRSSNACDYGNEKEVIKDYEKVGHE